MDTPGYTYLDVDRIEGNHLSVISDLSWGNAGSMTVSIAKNRTAL